MNISSCEADIPIEIIDDEIDEADEQIFVAMVELVDALHPSLVTISPQDMFTLIRIQDNDREYLASLVVSLT